MIDETYIFPVSFAQQRLWFLDQLEPGSTAYNFPLIVRLEGALDVQALEWSLNEIVRRHEALRTSFSVEAGAAVQVIAGSVTLELRKVDLSGVAGEEQEEQVRQRIAAEAEAPFDLRQGPLLRGSLLRLGEREHVLVLTMHHIVCDGWSLGILFRELSVLYEAYREGTGSPLAELKVQYADYAVWQREWLRGAVLEQQLGYWREQLGGMAGVLELPADRVRPAVQSYRGAREKRKLGGELTAALKQLSQEAGATLYMTLLAGFTALLRRYSGQEEIVVGTPHANRTRAEVEGLIGFFVNTLVLRTDVSGDPSFSELLRRVKAVCLGAYSHQDLPFERLVEELEPERRLSHNPLFQIVFTYVEAANNELKLPGLTATISEGLNYGSSKFELNLIVIPHFGEAEDDVTLVWEYNTDLFDASTIARMAQHFERVLRAAVASPEQRVSELRLLSEQERRQLLVEFNETNRSYSQELCLHQLFERQVAKTPAAIALTHEEEELSYAELNGRANQLARYLRKTGVGPEVLVGICLERSLAMVTAVLGILKAGGAYLPLDPSYPRERLEFMLADAGVKVLVTEEAAAEQSGRQTVRLSEAAAAIAAESAADLSNDTLPANLAYVIYTSGSTGQPKGVQIGHYNVTRLFEATRSWFHFDENDVWTLFHSYAFDFSVWEIWGALLHGGKLIVISKWNNRNPEAFYNLLGERGVTVLNQVPSVFRQLVEVEKTTEVRRDPALRLIIFGGEALDVQSLKPWFDRHGDRQIQLVNMYGITETTVHVTYAPLSSGDMVRGTGVIGKPIFDLQVYLLDERQRPVPIGIAGEIHVAGAGLARGYANRPALTAERFLPNPYSTEPGARMYRSGDLARYDSNGELEFLGRADHQVKIRGFRIELGEIEALLGRHEAISHAVVIAREEPAGDKRLVAYVVCGENPVPSTSDLRSYLQQRLPEYMVPSAFVVLESMPLTANGKLNHRALPAPESLRPKLDVDCIAPRTLTEKLLAELWVELLGVEQVGIHDNFFDLGGHSILATVMISSVRKQINVDLPVRSIFELPTIAELAALISKIQSSGIEPESLSIVPVSRVPQRVPVAAGELA